MRFERVFWFGGGGGVHHTLIQCLQYFPLCFCMTVHLGKDGLWPWRDDLVRTRLIIQSALVIYGVVWPCKNKQ
jgi:hypothetical protein